MMLVMEFLEKGPVLQTHDQAGFDCLPEEVAADYFRQAVAGLEYLHFHRVRGVCGCASVREHQSTVWVNARARPVQGPAVRNDC
jgi:serine/threonine protein kinase